MSFLAKNAEKASKKARINRALSKTIRSASTSASASSASPVYSPLAKNSEKIVKKVKLDVAGTPFSQTLFGKNTEKVANKLSSIETSSQDQKPKKEKPDVVETFPLRDVLPGLFKAMEQVSVKPVYNKSDMTVFLISNSKHAELFLDHILTRCGHHLRLLGIDTETQVTFPAYGKVTYPPKIQAPSTIQIAFGENLVAIFQVFRMCGLQNLNTKRFPQTLIKILQSSRILKVGVALSSDIAGLAKYYPVTVQNVVDLDAMATAMNLPGISLGALAYLYCNHELDKRKKLVFARWDGELKQESIIYAAKDALYSRNIYERMVVRPQLEINKQELQAIVKRNK